MGPLLHGHLLPNEISQEGHFLEEFCLKQVHLLIEFSPLATSLDFLFNQVHPRLPTPGVQHLTWLSQDEAEVILREKDGLDFFLIIGNPP